MSRILPLLVLLAASRLLGGCASPAPPNVQAALDAAMANLETAEGQKYDGVFGVEVSPRLHTAVASCARSMRPIGGGTNLLYRIDGSGRPVESFIYPDTSMGYCVRDMLAGFTLPPPPAPDYWVIIMLGI